MGSEQSDLTESQFKEQWKVSEHTNGLTIWELKKDSRHKLEQYNIRDDLADKESQKLAQLRKTSPFLVKAYTLKKEGFSCQIDHDAKKLFVQRITLRLSDLKDIPYPDIFHLYDVCLNGYKLLTQTVGYFSIDQGQIGINQEGRAKVWLSTLFDSNKIIGGKVTQPKMVSQMLEMLRQVADNESCGTYPNIYWYVGNHQNITFAEVHQKFEQYIKAYCEGWVPTHLNCIHEVGSSQIEKWCKTHKSIDYTTRQSQPIYQTHAELNGQAVGNNIAPGITYINKPSAQPIPIVNSAVFNPPFDNQTLVKTPAPYTNATVVEYRASRPYPTNAVIAPAVPQTGSGDIITSMVRPLNPPTLVSAVQPNSKMALNNRPATNLGLAQTSSQNFTTQNIPQPIHKPVSLNSQVKFVSKNGVAATQLLQPGFSNSQRPLAYQSNSYLPIVVASQGHSKISVQKQTQFPPQFYKSQTVAVHNNHFASQNFSQISNQPAQLFGTFSLPRGENQLQQQRVISQTIEIKDGGKAVEVQANNFSNGSANHKNELKASQTLQWQDYTNKQTVMNGLSTYGRSVPFSLDIAADKKPETQYETTKYTPENEGKSSAQFLALLSQLKQTNGATSGQSYSYSYSPSKLEARSYGLGSAFQDSKFTTSNYVPSKYEAGFDAQVLKYKQ